MSNGSGKITDAALDSVIRDAVSVDLPSSFVDRTRMRIADIPPRWTTGRWLVPCTVLASVVVTAVILMPSQRNSTPEALVDIPLASGTNIVLHPASDTQRTQASTLYGRDPTGTPPRRRAATQAALEPKFQVLISPSDAAAYERLFATMAAQSYEIVLDESKPRLSPEERLADIEIVPIAIAPLGAENEGALQ